MAGVHGFTQQEKQRRYKLHKLVRKSGFKLIARSRTFFIPLDFDIRQNEYMAELVKNFGYNAQTEAFSNEGETGLAV